MSTQPDRRILVDLKDRHLPNSIGSKALQLRRLMDNGVRIPNTLRTKVRTLFPRFGVAIWFRDWDSHQKARLPRNDMMTVQ